MRDFVNCVLWDIGAGPIAHLVHVASLPGPLITYHGIVKDFRVGSAGGVGVEWLPTGRLVGCLFT